MFESSVFRLVASVAFAVLFAYLEQQVSLGILASALLTFVLFRQKCQRWLALVLFLSEVNALTTAHVHLMWKAAISSHEADIVDEIFSLLVHTSWHLRTDLFKALIELGTY